MTGSAINAISTGFFKNTNNKDSAKVNAKFLILVTADFKDSDNYDISLTLPVSVLALTNTSRYYQVSCLNTGGMCQLEWGVSKSSVSSPKVFRNGTQIASSDVTFTYTYA